MNPPLTTPVSVFFYRRPDHLRKVMERVRAARPLRLFGVSDGPRPDRPETRAGVEQSRRVFREAIDWTCDWELQERETNVGSYLSVSRGLDEILAKVDRTIILEDDTVPEPSFFRVVAELLERYRDEARIGAVCGNNYDDPKDWSGQASYRMSRYHHSWGWGTWSRAWRFFDRDEKLLAKLTDRTWRRSLPLSRREWAYWERCFRRAYARELDAWDYRWTLSLWVHGMSSLIPRCNLVRNIGFDSLGTHTIEENFRHHPMHNPEGISFPLTHPAHLQPEPLLDDRVFKRHYRVLEGRREWWEKLRDRFSPSRRRASWPPSPK